MNKKLIGLINSPEFNGGSLAYHALQPRIEIDWLNGYALPRVQRFVIGDPLSATGPNESLPDSRDLRKIFGHLSFAHIGAEFARSLKSAGYNISAMGCEAIVDLPFSLAGKSKSDLRRARNQSLNAGVSVREISELEYITYSPEIERANSEWLSNRPLFRREFRFLARPFVKRFEAGERRFVALREGSVVGLAVYDPIVKRGSPAGYLEAIIRSYQAAPPGVRDLLTLTAMNQFAVEGLAELSLGLCPFQRHQDNSGLVNSRLTDFALRIFYQFGSQVFNCRGLAFHKSRYRPRFNTVYFATLSPWVLIELNEICRLSNIDALYPAFRLWENIYKRLASTFRPASNRLETEKTTLF